MPLLYLHIPGHRLALMSGACPYMPAIGPWGQMLKLEYASGQCVGFSCLLSWRRERLTL